MMREALAALFLVAFLAGSAQAADQGSPTEAKAMLAKAVEHYTAVGRKQALADFTSHKAPFWDRDLYVFCIGADRTIVANGAYPFFVGTSADALKDAEGKALGKTLLATGSRAGGGAVEYPLINPVTHKPQIKVSFLEKVGEDVCGVGAFK